MSKQIDAWIWKEAEIHFVYPHLQSVIAAVTDRVDSKKAVIDAAMAIVGVVIEMVTSLFLFLDFTYVHDICGYEVLGLDNVAR